MEVSAAECDLLALPLRLGGLAVSNPVFTASYFYDSLIRSTVVLVKSLVSDSVLCCLNLMLILKLCPLLR